MWGRSQVSVIKPKNGRLKYYLCKALNKCQINNSKKWVEFPDFFSKKNPNLRVFTWPDHPFTFNEENICERDGGVSEVSGKGLTECLVPVRGMTYWRIDIVTYWHSNIPPTCPTCALARRPGGRQLLPEPADKLWDISLSLYFCYFRYSISICLNCWIGRD